MDTHRRPQGALTAPQSTTTEPTNLEVDDKAMVQALCGPSSLVDAWATEQDLPDWIQSASCFDGKDRDVVMRSLQACAKGLLTQQ